MVEYHYPNNPSCSCSRCKRIANENAELAGSAIGCGIVCFLAVLCVPIFFPMLLIHKHKYRFIAYAVLTVVCLAADVVLPLTLAKPQKEPAEHQTTTYDYDWIQQVIDDAFNVTRSDEETHDDPYGDIFRSPDKSLTDYSVWDWALLFARWLCGFYLLLTIIFGLLYLCSCVKERANQRPSPPANRRPAPPTQPNYAPPYGQGHQHVPAGVYFQPQTPQGGQVYWVQR